MFSVILELRQPGSEGLQEAIAEYLSPIKKQCPLVSWADLFQMAGACSIEASGGPIIDMQYGRVDGVQSIENFDKNHHFSQVSPPFIYSKTKINNNKEEEEDERNEEDPVVYLKNMFSRFNMTNQDIVTLLGCHTLGRCFIERSGTVKEGKRRGTKYTQVGCPYLQNNNQNQNQNHSKVITKGGKSWTTNWLQFDNSYYTEINKDNHDDKNLIKFPIDIVLKTHPDFKEYFELYCKSQKEFFNAYKISHKKMSELGAKFDPPEGIII